ncbi:MAG: GntR family transcriptional regulator [Acidobacteriota bacterium]
MLLQLTDLSDEPLHSQLSRQVRAKILAGDLEDGESLPSIRGLARQARVSVITVQRAYEDLEREGLIVARRGKGFFVRAMGEEAKGQLARERFSDALRPVVLEGRAEGLDDRTMSTIFNAVLDPDSSDGEKS